MEQRMLDKLYAVCDYALDGNIIDIGEAKELADAYGLKTKEITSAAKSGELINNKWKIERVIC